VGVGEFYRKKGLSALHKPATRPYRLLPAARDDLWVLASPRPHGIVGAKIVERAALESLHEVAVGGH